MIKKKPTKVEEAQAAFDLDNTPENELALEKAKREEADKALAAKDKEIETIKKATVTGAGPGVSDIVAATVKAIKVANKPKHRPTKTQVNKLIKCDEFVVQESEGRPGDMTVVETLRKGIQLTAEQMNRVNAPALKQSRAKIYAPAGAITTYLDKLGKARKANLKNQ